MIMLEGYSDTTSSGIESHRSIDHTINLVIWYNWF
ncbi:hypothetical protein F383_09603 [Gossypium arboreum]|uniref:Uncharacterized protein n=1 Tax=Gossypium arboreum TaxID=29729 RepID=A0A0B0PK69_GOSAR|nr:hypothetical protein F383_09603 [Gossypium arboreum]